MVKINIFSILIFCIVFCSFGMATVSVVSGENLFFNAMLAVTIGCFFFIKILQRPFVKFKIVLLFFLAMIPLVATFRMNLISLSLMIILIFFKNELFNSKGRKLYLLFSIVCLVCIYIASVFGFNSIFSQDIWNPREEVFVYRASLGFTHPNQAMLKFFGVVLVWFVGVSRCNVVRHSVLAVLLVTLLYFFTVSRTVTVVVVCTSIVLILFRNRLDAQVPLVVYRVISFYPLIFFLISFVAMKFSENEFLNLLFSGRLGFYNAAVDTYGFSLFGTSSIEKGGGIIIDSSYFNTPLSKGILFFLCYILIFKYAASKTDITYKKWILLTAFFLCAFTETMFFKFDLMFSLLMILFYERTQAV